MVKPLPPSIKSHPDAWLWKKCWERPHWKNQMFSAVICGGCGSGKTYLALKLADMLDRNSDDVSRFDVSRVVFSPKEFAQLINQDLPVGSCIVVDDAGLTLFNRDSMSAQVKDLSKVFQSIRHRNLIILITLPSFSMLDSNVRRLADSVIETQHIDRKKNTSTFRFFWLDAHPYLNKLYRKRPILIRKSKVYLSPEQSSWKMIYDDKAKTCVQQEYVIPPVSDYTYHRIKVDSFTLDKPPESLTVPYEKIRAAKMKEFYADVLDRTEGDKKQKKNSFKDQYAKAKSKLETLLNGKGLVDEGKLLLLGVSPRYSGSIRRLLNEELKNTPA